MEIFKNTKLVFVIALIITIVAIITIFNPSCEKNVKQEWVKITFALDWTPNTNHTGLFVAKEKRFFEEEGIDISIIQPPEDIATSLVASKKAEFGIDFQDYLAPAYVEGLPITSIAAVVQHNTSGVISIKDDNILSPKNMENKTYATAEMPMEQAIIKYCIEKDGGDVSKVSMIPTYVTDVVQALSTNIDAVWIFYGWDGIATKVNNLATNFFAFKDIDPIFDYYTPVIVGNNEFMENNPELTSKFLRACKKGYEYAIENPEEAAEILLRADPTLDRELVIESQKYISEQYKLDVDKWGYIDKERWNNFYNWLYENNLIEKEITGGFTNQYLEN